MGGIDGLSRERPLRSVGPEPGRINTAASTRPAGMVSVPTRRYPALSKETSRDAASRAPAGGPASKLQRSRKAPGPRCIRRASGALDDDHVEIGRAEAVLARLLVFGRVVELLCRLDSWEFAHDDALERDVALQRGLLAAAHQEPAAVLGVGRPGPFRIFLVLLRVLYVHHCDDIGGHCRSFTG